MINIAVDQAVGMKRIKKLTALGYNVVCFARPGEPDEEWMNRAFTMNAIFVVSPDSDIPKIIEKEKYPMSWINYPVDDKDQDDLVAYVNKMIKFKVNFYKYVAESLKDLK